MIHLEQLLMVLLATNKHCSSIWMSFSYKSTFISKLNLHFAGKLTSKNPGFEVLHHISFFFYFLGGISFQGKAVEHGIKK